MTYIKQNALISGLPPVQSAQAARLAQAVRLVQAVGLVPPARPARAMPPERVPARSASPYH